MRIARIVEADCIGCTQCLKACPVDAIVGAAGQMHAVLVEYCTGCEECLPPCPVDCIELVDAPFEWDGSRAAAAMAREEARDLRLARRRETGRGAGRRLETEIPDFDPATAKDQIRAAVARREARRKSLLCP